MNRHQFNHGDAEFMENGRTGDGKSPESFKLGYPARNFDRSGLSLRAVLVAVVSKLFAYSILRV